MISVYPSCGPRNEPRLLFFHAGGLVIFQLKLAGWKEGMSWNDPV